MLETIGKQSSEAKAIESIRTEILAGGLALGTRLVEAELAAACGLSRGTIRAALRVLESEGLVASEPYRGYTVATLTAHDVWEVFTLRNAYESMAARLVASEIDDLKRDSINAAFETLQDAVRAHDKAHIFESDFNLHRAIVTLTGHQRLRDSYLRLERQAKLFYVLCNEFMSFDDYISSHEEMLAAIYRGDAETAGEMASHHNTNDGQAVVNKLRAIEESREANRLQIVPRKSSVAVETAE